MAEQLILSVNGEQQPPKVGDIDRMLALQDNAGFVPTCRDELTRSFMLLSYVHLRSGSARHLNEILLHRKNEIAEQHEAEQEQRLAQGLDIEKLSDDAINNEAGRAVMSVTQTFREYAERAQVDRSHLLLLSDEISNTSSNALDRPLSSISREPTEGAVRFVRYVDLKEYAETGDKRKHGFDPLRSRTVQRTNKGRSRKIILDPYTGNRSDKVKAHVQEVLRETTMADAESILPHAIADQNCRFEFWAQRLREARQHIVARPVANTALESLGIPYKKQ